MSCFAQAWFVSEVTDEYLPTGLSNVDSRHGADQAIRDQANHLNFGPPAESAKTRAQIAKKGAPHETAPNSGTATGRILGSSPRRGGAPAGSRRPLGPPARRAQLGEFALCAQAL